MKTMYVALVLIVVILLGMAGCGGGVQQAQPRRTVPSITGGYGYGSEADVSSVKAADQVQVVEANFYGHQALKMTNGLVTLVAVPEFGGRIMEYKIGSKPLLWVNLSEVEAARPVREQAGDANSAASRTWRNWGGYKVWPAPQIRWQGPPDPPGSALDGGRWVGRIVKPRGSVGEIELVSPPDKAVTGLQITRRVTMEVGTTRVRVEEIFKNVGSQPVEWSIWAVTQVPGSLAPEEAFSEDARVYFPLNLQSRFQGGYKQLIDRSSSQWRVIDGNLMEVSYKKELGKIGADSAAGWIAYVDDRHDWAYVKQFEFQPGATYPDGGCSVEVFTSDKEAYMELELLSPLQKLAPGAEMRFAQEWFAARVSAPIRQVIDGAAISEPLQLEVRDGKTWVVGLLGVFQPAKLQIMALDENDKALGNVVEQAVSVAEPVRLSTEVEVPKEAAAVKVKLVADKASWQLARLVIERGKQG
jgi:hypothetical protein